MAFLRKHSWFIFLLLLLALLSLRHLFHPGIYTAHDIWHNLARLKYYLNSVYDGQFPPYYLGNIAEGFGYPLFVFSYHFPWIFSLPFAFAGLKDIEIVKVLFVLGYFLSGVMMYLFIYELTKKRVISLVSAFFYLWAPYRFFIIYVSAAVGISFTFIFLPLVFWGILKLSKEKETWKGIVIMTIGLSGMILSHTPTFFVLFFTIGSFIFFIFIKTKRKILFLKNFILSIVLSLALSAFYLFPAIFYKTDTVGFPSIYTMGFVSLKQLVYSKWGYGIIVRSASENPFSFQIGIAQWLIFLVSIYYLIVNYKKIKSNILILILVICYLVNVYLMLPESKIIWINILSYLGLDFPFRFIYANVFLSSLLFPLLVVKMKRNLFRAAFTLFLIIIALFTNRNHLRPNMFLLEDQYKPIVDAEVTTSSYNEYLPSNADTKLIKKDMFDLILRQNNLSLVTQNTTKSVYNLSLFKDSQVVFPKYYYPYLHLYVEGEEKPILASGEGLVSAFISKENKTAVLVFEKSIIMRVSSALSLITFSLFIVYISKNIFYNKITNRLL